MINRKNLIFASVDAGNGFTNGVCSKLSGQVHKTAFPSVRADAPEGKLGVGADLEHSYEIIEWLGNKYTYGSDVVRLSANALERHHGRDRYGNEFHAMLVALALARLGVKSGSQVSLTLFMPPGMFSKLDLEFVKKSFLPGLSITIAKKFIEWEIVEVNIQPEGLGAALAFILSPTGRQVKTNVLDGEVLVMDSGSYTLDTLLLRNGRFDPASLESATWDNDGLYRHIIMPLLAAVKNSGDDDFLHITPDMVDKAVYDSTYSKKCVIHSAGKIMNMTEALDHLSKKYATWIANNIFDNIHRGLNGIRSVIIVGGGHHLITKHFLTMDGYSEKILDYSAHKSVRSERPTDLNAVGGQRWARYSARMS